jgi:hypothetical protein
MSRLTLYADALYEAVVDDKPSFEQRMPVIIAAASNLLDVIGDDKHPMAEQCRETMHDYSLMLAGRMQYDDCDYYDKHLYSPVPHDDIIGALEESGWVTS